MIVVCIFGFWLNKVFFNLLWVSTVVVVDIVTNIYTWTRYPPSYINEYYLLTNCKREYKTCLGGCSPSYILQTRSGPVYWVVSFPAKRIIKWWCYPKNIVCDGVLHVNMFCCFKIPCITCTFFTKFIYNEYIGTFFLSHVVSKKIASAPPP